MNIGMLLGSIMSRVTVTVTIVDPLSRKRVNGEEPGADMPALSICNWARAAAFRG
jgi:hypothetical protein